MVAKTMLFVFAILLLPLQKGDAQDQEGCVEVSFALGRHLVLNDLDPQDPERVYVLECAETCPVFPTSPQLSTEAE